MKSKSIFSRFLSSIFLVSLVFSSSLFADSFKSNLQQIVDLLASRANATIEIKDVQKGFIDDFSLATLEIKDSGLIQVLASKDGKSIIPFSANNLFTLDDKLSKKIEDLQAKLKSIEMEKKRETDVKVMKLFSDKSIPVLSIKSSKKNAQTMYMIIDTTCPFCKEEIDKLETTLKDYNVKFIVAGILNHGGNAVARAGGYYKDLPKATTTNKKLELLHKVFESSYSPTAEQANTALSQEILNKVIKAGVTYVPYKIIK